MSALDEKTKAERALKDLQKVQGEEQVLFGVWLANTFPFYYFFFFFLTLFLNSLHLKIRCHLVLSANLGLKWYVSG